MSKLRLTSSDRLKRAYDLLSSPAVLRGQAGDDEIIRIILAEIQELRRKLAIREKANG
jgi:hypothetical protein